METTIVALTGASAPELALLATQGVTSGQDLSMITYVDIITILPNSGLLTRRKLSLIGQYIGKGQNVTPAITMPGIVLFLNTPTVQATTGPPPIGSPIHPPDPTRGALKLYVNGLTEFSRNPIEYEQWELAARATLGQTVYGKLLETPPPTGDIILETRNNELYHMFVTAFMNSSGMHLLNLVADQDGHTAFTAIKD